MENYADLQIVKDYRAMMGKAFSALLPTKAARDKAQHLADLVVDLETQIIEVLPSLEDQREVSVS
jgi:hypothetical protein